MGGLQERSDGGKVVERCRPKRLRGGHDSASVTRPTIGPNVEVPGAYDRDANA
jgi:hypothetical protein